MLLALGICHRMHAVDRSISLRQLRNPASRVVQLQECALHTVLVTVGKPPSDINHERWFQHGPPTSSKAATSDYVTRSAERTGPPERMLQ